MPEDLNDEELPQGFRSHMRSLERQIKDLTSEVDSLRPLQRENVFLKAGIDLKDPKSRYFVKGYDGELSEDAVIAAAKEAGFLGQPATQEQQQPDPRLAEMEEMHRAGQSAAGAQAASSDKQFDDRIYAAKSAEEVLDLLRQRGTPAMTDTGYD